ncbi:MAG TPA: FAD-dependent oxidoreductase [Terracidiphilus sp.]|jgi:NADPH-dependent 2,4-dienoyl-CoA reductase/sulfur reductase-like enzyme/nitrite reductase/ring-hydroxylating ferredoxin subunit|nr:FAD-dependent oxidoreductase [Terracidiphilus sp.]
MAEMKVLDNHELPFGSRRVVKIGTTDVLLIHCEAGVVGVQSKCPHAGGPLQEGAVCNGRLICPWHMGTFALPGGELVEPPAMVPLKTYPVRLRDEGIFVDDKPNVTGARPEAPCGSDRLILIVGAGAAGAMAIATMHERHFSGCIVVVDPVDEEPVDRTQLSKDALAGKVPLDQVGLSMASEIKIDHVHASVSAFSAARREAVLSDGTTIQFDRALIATGGIPKHLEIPGSELAYTIRHVRDVMKIHGALEGKRKVIILGGSFIALEAASALIEKGHHVTVVAKEPLPFARQFGDRAAAALKRLHESHGTNFRLDVEILAITAQGVEISNGNTSETLQADVVIAGVGVSPALNFSHDLPLSDKGGIRVDNSLRAAAGVWVAGDIAAIDGSRIEHWRVAQQHGRVAALAMIGDEAHYGGVPFFWTYHFGKRIDYLGASSHWDEIAFDGDPEEMKFTAFYLKNDGGERMVEAVLSCGRETETAMLAEMMRTPITLARARMELERQIQVPA